MKPEIPRSKDNDYSPEILEQRQAFIEEQTGARLEHSKQYSFDPQSMSGNIESIWGVSQIPIGLAGPLLINGEHAEGEFYVPMATVEGTMLASYNRGMKVIRDSGGVTTTVCGEAMQRAPVFVFNNARQARDFAVWLDDNFEAIKAQAEETTSVGKLTDIDHYIVHNFVWSRFNYTTGDAANIAESHQASVYTRLTSRGDYYYSITLPSLILATYGGGTGLATQRECLEIMDCYGTDRAYKLCEIAAGLVVAGELSLGAATRIDPYSRTSDWVESHETLGRNRQQEVFRCPH